QSRYRGRGAGQRGQRLRRARVGAGRWCRHGRCRLDAVSPSGGHAAAVSGDGLARDRRAFPLSAGTAILERTPSTLTALLGGLPDTWITANEGGDSWSPFDVVGHLIHGERTDWMQRVRAILEEGEAKPFDTFDRFAQFRESAGRTLKSL